MIGFKLMQFDFYELDFDFITFIHFKYFSLDDCDTIVLLNEID